MLSILLFAVGAIAHQNLHQIWINGVSPGYEKCIRMPPSNSPVINLQSNDITCNVNGNNVPSSASICSAKPGDTIKVQWDSSTHPGPITHFLQAVPNAQQATGIGQWFKIDERDYVNGKWANEFMEAQNMTYEFKLPAKLPSGDYLLRSEMETLHASTTMDTTQFYIGCAHLRVTGGTGSSCGPKITLPGAYKDTDKNIYISNFYYGFDPTTFTAPGGPTATCT